MQQREYRHVYNLNDSGYPIDELLPEAEPVEYTMKAEDTTITHMRNFFRCVRTREVPIEDLEAGHLAATVGHMVNLSILKNNRVMKWDAQKRAVV